MLATVDGSTRKHPVTVASDEHFNFLATLTANDALLNPLGTQPLLPLRQAEQVLPHLPSHYGAALQSIEQWVDDYLMQPHPELGRKGAMCPYMAHAMRINHVFVTLLPGADFALSDLCDYIRQSRSTFQAMSSKTAKEAQYRCILMLFPELAHNASDELFQRVLEVLKTEFVQQGLMLGEFNGVPPEKYGLHNPNFKPLYAPVPLLAIRHMVKTDILFLRDDPVHEQAYEQRFREVNA